jgi:hypothetical protein
MVSKSYYQGYLRCFNKYFSKNNIFLEISLDQNKGLLDYIANNKNKTECKKQLYLLLNTDIYKYNEYKNSDTNIKNKIRELKEAEEIKNLKIKELNKKHYQAFIKKIPLKLKKIFDNFYCGDLNEIIKVSYRYNIEIEKCTQNELTNKLKNNEFEVYQIEIHANNNLLLLLFPNKKINFNYNNIYGYVSLTRKETIELFSKYS